MKLSLWSKLGPGILLAATSIGASHLVHSPRAGALFGLHLLWLVVVSHVFKYPAFEFGPRYAAATGKSLLHGYASVPGPRSWALYVFLVSTVLQGIGVLAGVVNVSGCVLASWLQSSETTELFSLLILASVLLFLFIGGFSWMDHINKVMMAILALATLLAFIPIVPSPSEFTHLVMPELPDGSIILVAAILGWMPTGIDVSIWHSFWTLEKMGQLGEKVDNLSLEDRIRRLKLALTDMRVGYSLSLITGIMFMVLGAAHLTGRGAELDGTQFAEAISTAYTAIFGRWMYHVFMMTAFFAMFSTSYTVIDGFSRSFSETLAQIRPSLREKRARLLTYRGFIVASAILAAVTIEWIGNPVTLVVAVSLISLAVAPILYALNQYCIRRDITDPALKPSPVTVGIGWLGILFMILALVVMVYVKLIK
ncbi:MAG: divalent metal cation transporter [Deltaproteobacteria bacterium]|nr:divalent metal cation transporter [Deltaproteobacteria bacterium]